MNDTASIKTNDSHTEFFAAATPLFTQQALNGVSVRQLAKAAGVNISYISYYVNGKEGLYSAVREEQFSNLKRMADLEMLEIPPSENSKSYFCYAEYNSHEGSSEEITASAFVRLHGSPRFLKKDCNSFPEHTALEKKAA